MGSIYDWSTSPGTNANADSDFTMAEGMQASQVNDGIRWIMARVAQHLETIGCTAVATGSPNGISVFVANPTTTYTDGMIAGFQAISDNTGATTLSVNGGLAKPIKKQQAGGLVALVGGEIKDDGRYLVIYNDTDGSWLLFNAGGSAFSTLVPAPNKVPYYNASSEAALATLTPFARTILDDADAVAVRNTIGLPYETGTFTPTCAFSNNGNFNPSYSTQTGTYIKIGSLVSFYIELKFDCNNNTTSSGGFYISGLPFAPARPAGLSLGPLQDKWTWPFVLVQNIGEMPIVSLGGTVFSRIVFSQMDPGGTMSSIGPALIPSNTNNILFSLSGTYQT